MRTKNISIVRYCFGNFTYSLPHYRNILYTSGVYLIFCFKAIFYDFKKVSIFLPEKTIILCRIKNFYKLVNVQPFLNNFLKLRKFNIISINLI